jgi:hypothetical protein
VPIPVFADVSSHTVLKGARDVMVVLTMSQRAAIELAGRLGVPPVDIDDYIVGDLAGELLNVICGCVQKHESFVFGVPSVETGRHHEVSPLRGGFGERLVSHTVAPDSGVGDLELFVVDCTPTS